MEIPNRLLVALLIFGVVVAAVLWGCGVVPWWAAPIVVLVAPIAACAVLALLFYAAWTASGSH
jgi:glucan phosphoethanolaminetransferase (alkaline phosphatase superfamily)